MTKDIFGEKSTQYAHSCFLNAKTLMMSIGSNPEETLKSINTAIDIEEEIQKGRPVKNSILGRYHYCAGTIY